VAQIAFQGDSARHVEPDLHHRLAEQLAVFRLVDRRGRGADQLDLVLLQNAALAQAEGGVECGLPAHRRQQGEDFSGRNVDALALDDLLQELRRDRFDIGGVRQSRVGHDRGRVGIHQDDAVALGAQRLAGLGARIVEFASLTDDDGSGADDQNGVDVVTLGHLISRAGGRTVRLHDLRRRKFGLSGSFSEGTRPLQPLI